VAVELKKHHDMMKKKVEKVTKEKMENLNQLKSLYALFQQQRKALEVSIMKNKKYEEDQ
jgi:Holliday junction resolvase-like predicted endonuclease